MEFQFSDDQTALQEGIRTFCEGRFPFDAIPELEKEPFNRGIWSELAEMGVFALRLPEEAGGLGLGMADAAIVFAELGRRVVPGPAIWGHVMAGVIDGVATGDVIVGGLDHTLGSSPGPAMIEYGPHLDALVVLEKDGVYRVEASALKGELVKDPLDPLTPILAVPDLPAGEKIADADTADRVRLEAMALTSAFFLGIAESAQEYAVAYSKTREQFDRPISGFQAIKHFAADMYVKQEVARAAVYAAGCAVDDPEIGDPVRAVASARVVAGDAAMHNSRKCVQIYGGMGFTWEMPPHYYLKRTWVLENAFGTGEDAAEIVADRIRLV
jgi:alkylation response protein AidB-like acyl-CoA dehydrogenase